MDNSDSLNPYAPPAADETAVPIIIPTSTTITNGRVCVAAICSISICGGLFGIAAVSMETFGGGFALPTPLLTIFFLAAFIGIGLAGAVSLLGVPTTLAFFYLFREPSDPWLPGQLRLFGSCAGFISGYLSLVLVSPIMAFFPAIFAGIVAPLLMWRVVREAKQQHLADSPA